MALARCAGPPSSEKAGSLVTRRTSASTAAPPSPPAPAASHTMWHMTPTMLAVAALSAPPLRGRKYPPAPLRRR